MIDIIEVSYEIGNKIGGIHTVIRSKLPEMLKRFKDRYLAIGVFSKRSRLEFEPEPLDFDIPEIDGLKIYTGKWFGANAILIDHSGWMEKRNDIKKWLWDNFRVDSLTAGQDFDDPVVWGWAVADLILSLPLSDPVLHFHEWLAGSALLRLREWKTVFTTHATVAGRTIAGNNYDLYGIMERKEEFETILREKNVIAKHLLEKATAENCRIFTTVSESTAREAEYFLGRRPDKVLPNGIDVSNYPSMEELYYLHKQSKRKILEFIKAYFGPYGPVNTDDPRIFMTAGRYEFRNKGYDVLIRALGKLERMLDSRRDIFVFFLVPSDVSSEKDEVIDNVMNYSELKAVAKEIGDSMREELPEAVINGMEEEMLAKSILARFRAKIRAVKSAFRKDGKAPLCSHSLNYPEGDDPIIRSLLAEGLDNSPERKVKVIFYPVYIKPGDKLLDIDSYDEFLRGCSAGIFPSYYEPWGYTPLEAAVNGVVAVTTNLSGFGKFLLKEGREGIYVIDAENPEKAAAELAKILHDLATMDKNAIGEIKARCRKDAEKADWKSLISHYLEVYEWLGKKSS